MAYVSQDKKKIIAAALKVALKGHPEVKYTLSVDNLSTINFNCKSGPKSLNPDNKESLTVNHYHIDKFYSGETAKLLHAILGALNTGNHDNSDAQSDYFDVGHYIHINIGRWNSPFVGV